MAKLMDVMGRWFNSDSTGKGAEAVDPILVLEQALETCRQKQSQDAVRAETLAREMEQSLQSRHMWVCGFDRRAGEQCLGQRADRELREALCQEGESFQDALARCSRQETVETVIGHLHCILKVVRHVCDQSVIYTVADVTDAKRLLQEQQDARLRDPVTGLYTWETFLEMGQKRLQPQMQICAVHMQPRLRTDLAGMGPAGTTEAFLRDWTDVVDTLPCPGLFTRSENQAICGILYGYDPEALPEILEELCKELQKKTRFLAPVGLDCYGVITGTACYPEDGKSLEELLLRARLSAWLADREGREGCAPYPGDDAVPECLLWGREPLRKLVEDKQVGFLLQPIVRTTNAKVEGYAMSMVSRSPDLPEMEQVIQTARFWGGLQDLERLLWFEGMEWVKEQIRNSRLRYNTKLWIPSISGACLTEEDNRLFEEVCYDQLRHLVLQLDGPREDLLHLGIKNSRWNGSQELRCTGLDQASRLALSYVQPKLVRVDAVLVEGIAADKKKQEIFKNLKAQSKSFGGKLLADGISNSADLNMVIKLGADFLQGDCLGRPDSGTADVPEIRIAQIGEAHYGKRG